MEMHEMLKGVADKMDLVRFIEALVNDFKTNRHRWENDSLEHYLLALASWLEDSDAVYRNRGSEPPPNPHWRDVAECYSLHPCTSRRLADGTQMKSRPAANGRSRTG
jgi:hypothetical protein